MKDSFIDKVGVWGRRHYNYLKKHSPTVINAMRLDGTLEQYITDFDRDTQEMYDHMISQYVELEGVTEELKAKDNLEWTRRMEYCLNTAFSWESFEKQLHGLGYTIDWKRMSVTGKGWDRAVRLNRIGYTEEVMQRRLDNNRHDNSFYAVVWNYNLPKKNKSRLLVQIAEELEFDLAHSHDVTEIYLDLLFLVLIRTLQALKAIKDAVIMSVDLRHCVKDLTEYVHDYRFMQKNGLHTLSQLNSYIHDTQKQISELEHERGLLRNKIRREKSPEVKAENREQRQKITEHITPLRKDLKRAKRIMEQSPHLYELIKQEHALEIQARAKNREYSTEFAVYTAYPPTSRWTTAITTKRISQCSVRRVIALPIKWAGRSCTRNRRTAYPVIRSEPKIATRYSPSRI